MITASSSIKKIAIASDHAGIDLKAALAKHLQALGFAVEDHGTNSTESVDYPDYAQKIAAEIIAQKAALGILICGSGVGMSIAANRFTGIRAALCHSEEIAKLAREHNDANILVLGARFLDLRTAQAITDIFLQTNFSGGRHANRVSKLDLKERLN
jgi:ribose 5-phosphate isomerase B